MTEIKWNMKLFPSPITAGVSVCKTVPTELKVKMHILQIY